MFTQIGAKPESDFSEPLGMLSDCHKRIQFFLADLVRLADEATEGPLEPAQRNALERAIRYFQESGPRHTADEEESLFPRLRAMNDSRNDARLETALVRIQELEADHQQANQAHAAVDAIGVRWLREGGLSAEDSAQLRVLLQELTELYRRHLVIEDEEVFPAAGRLLSARDKTELGREMATRRGLSAEIVKDTGRAALHS